MIPKVIHYCWFGKGEKSQKVKKCIASWKKYCSDFEIIEWNEENFDIGQNEYTKWCYENKKYAFLSDYARLYIVNQYGGIYFDTDVEVIKPINHLLKDEAFFGFETNEAVASGLGFGSIAHGKAVTMMLKEYDPLMKSQPELIGCPILNTRALVKLGLCKDGSRQNLEGTVIYPIEWFNPYDAPTGILNTTSNTVSIHWYAASWMKKSQRLRSMIGRPLHRIFGVNAFKRFRK